MCRATQFVNSCNYQIPLFAKVAATGSPDVSTTDGAVIGYALNPSVLGLYAALLVLASDILADDLDQAADRTAALRVIQGYREEAAKALTILRRYPISQLYHETVQLSLAAAAAHRLGRAGLRDDFTRCLLLSCYRSGRCSGLFQGCAGLGYPAFRETVEAIEHLPEWMASAPPDLPLRQIWALVMERAAAFLVAEGKAAGLPQEGLATREQPEAAEVGVAIYAAAQVFELARLQRQYPTLA